jgi:hypothetical protein
MGLGMGWGEGGMMGLNVWLRFLGLYDYYLLTFLR